MSPARKSNLGGQTHWALAEGLACCPSWALTGGFGVERHRRKGEPRTLVSHPPPSHTPKVWLKPADLHILCLSLTLSSATRGRCHEKLRAFDLHEPLPKIIYFFKVIYCIILAKVRFFFSYVVGSVHCLHPISLLWHLEVTKGNLSWECIHLVLLENTIM